MKIDRLIGILMLLINKEKVTAKQLAEHFSVSIRTIQRDIDTLTLAGIPLYADVGVHGGYQLLEDYKLSKSFLNHNEASVLIGFLKNIESAVPTSEVKSMIHKFDALSDNSHEPSKMIFHLNPGLDNELFQQHMTCLSKGRDQLKKIQMSYLNIDYKETTRIICPYTLLMYGNTWYVYAYCELRDDFRMFKLFRIKSCETLSETFDLKDLPSPLPWEVSLDTRSDTTKIVLEIDKRLQGKLPEYFDPKLLDIQENRIIASLDFPLDEWVYSLLMSMVPYIKILEPQFVRAEFASRLKKCFELNNYDIELS